MEDVENRRPKSMIFKGSPILDDQLWPKGNSAGGAQPYIPKGYNVVAVKVDDVSALGGILRPGDRVDVLVYMQSDPTHGIWRTEVRTFLQDVKVFGINEVFEPDSAGGDKKLSSARTVELLLTPKQAQAATLASELGKIRLSLRSLEVDESPPPPGTDTAQLFGNPPDKPDRNKEAGFVCVAGGCPRGDRRNPATQAAAAGAAAAGAAAESGSPQSVRQLENDADRRPRRQPLDLGARGRPERAPGGPVLEGERIARQSRDLEAQRRRAPPASLPFPTAPDAGKGKPTTGTGNDASSDGNNSNSKPATVPKAS